MTSLNGFAVPLRLELHPSRACVVLLTGLALLAALALVISQVAWLLKLVLALLMVGWLYSAYRQNSQMRCVERHEHVWWLRRDNEQIRAELVGFALIGHKMLILRFHNPAAHPLRRRIHWFACADAMDPQTFRQLRVFLRHGKLKETDDEIV